MSEKHTFAIFYQDLSKIADTRTGSQIQFADKDLEHRVFKILRLQNGEQLTLFDNSINLDLEILKTTGRTKHGLGGHILRLEENTIMPPEITLMPCILKKEAFEDIIYAAAQMAVTKVVPLISAKIQRNWGQSKEVERLTKVMIAACEQSKNFVIPELCKPIKIQDLSNYFDSSSKTTRVYFDPSGQNFLDLLQELRQKPGTRIVLLFGPEGGLTPEEEKIVVCAGFKTYALTPTILRSREAVIVGLGGVRSVTR